MDDILPNRAPYIPRIFKVRRLTQNELLISAIDLHDSVTDSNATDSNVTDSNVTDSNVTDSNVTNSYTQERKKTFV